MGKQISLSNKSKKAEHLENISLKERRRKKFNPNKSMCNQPSKNNNGGICFFIHFY